MIKKLRSYLVTGLIVLLPTIATIYVLQFAFSFIDRILGKPLTDLLNAMEISRLPEFNDRIPGLGFVLIILILLGVGYATKSLLGKRAISFTEKTIKKIPLARSVYSTVQQVTTALIQDRSSFKKVVLIEYPRKGIYTVGFLTGESQGEVQQKTEKECVNVFLPTTPNPTSGWLILVPKEEVTLLDMTVEQGLKFIISGGVVVPRTSPVIHTSSEEDIENILKRLDSATRLDPAVRVNIKKKEE
jgi:uncharacterized membrane protein